jgi:hypothetical protein
MNEQQMKEALDGKFFYLTAEGKTQCRDVPAGFSGEFKTYQYNSEAYRAGGLKTADKTKPSHDWTDREIMMLMYLRRKKTSVMQIHLKLGLSRWLVSKKCVELGI